MISLTSQGVLRSTTEITALDLPWRLCYKQMTFHSGEQFSEIGPRCLFSPYFYQKTLSEVTEVCVYLCQLPPYHIILHQIFVIVRASIKLNFTYLCHLFCFNFLQVTCVVYLEFIGNSYQVLLIQANLFETSTCS